MMPAKRVAILISGRGSNMASLVAAASDPAYPAEIVLVLSNRPGAAGLDRAADAGVAAETLDHKAFAGREAFDEALDARLRLAGAELVCLAGFMRILTASFVARWQGRLLNIHPSLLPAFPGLDTHQRALAAGVKLHGATVHFVGPGLDDGPIVAQAAVPVLSSDTAESLAARVLTAEHRLYPLALALVARGEARLLDGKVITAGIAASGPAGVLFSPPAPDV
jgi:phosphoribosylglycinamide formyltransferase-1